MFESTIKGCLTELKCQEAFISRGIIISQPISNDSRYDFVVDINNKFIRIQCKTANPSEDGLTFDFACSNKNWNSGERKSYIGEIDYFYTYYKEQDYLIPIEEAAKRTMKLRIDSDHYDNGCINWDELYFFDTVLNNELNYNSEAQVKKIREEYVAAMKARKGKKHGICQECGKPTSSTSTLICYECYKKKENEKWIATHPSREKLKEMIRTMSFCEIGKKYNVSDNTIRKWCDKLSLPRRRVDIDNINDEEWVNI